MGLANGFGSVQRAVPEVSGGVLAQVLQAVGVHSRALSPSSDDHEVAVPRLERLEAGQDLVPLRAALGTTHALVRLARWEIDALERRLLRSFASCPCASEIASSAAAASPGSKSGSR